ncbi:rho GTPase-activating protein 11A isoform X2 [Cololabis saira]|uniref:rho GTPase-activating protein 11A isoform X2 n=1 Tax=Cololabis saira TaxID=129043 RepID=UPI002AD2E7C7|nr:rho GTPase-activating protein 11A isoform X2 [Cololabis saira]
MKVLEKNVTRLAAVQQLRAAYGIKTKNWNKNKAASCKPTATYSAKVFGVSLDSLPYYNMECGKVPSFLVDACMKLLAHVDTEGLFRKSGSVVRLKALRGKLEVGEECLSTALPCDVAGLVKQFFRELPEPALPTDLQDAFLKAQQLPTEEERTSATVLLSCVLPDKNICVLTYFFDFLHNVSLRSAENKMDSSNLSVILAPNLLHCGDMTEKINAATEKRLKLQAATVQCLIENASNFGVLPQFLQEKIPAMMGCEPGVPSLTHDDLEELDPNVGVKRKQRRSFGVFSSATPVIATPSTKRKLPSESVHSFGFSNKKRRSIKKNLGLELLPSALFSGTSTPGSVHSASGVLDSSRNTLSSAGTSRRQPATSVRRKSKRQSNRHVINRVESGRSGCFSPKVNKKEAPRKSLRLRFSLGRSSKDAGTGSIGLRLATQESTTSFLFTKEMEFSPSVYAGKTESKGSKYISKSEDNLLSPQCDRSAHRTSWGGDTPVRAKSSSGGSFTDTPVDTCLKSGYVSEPVVSKSPGVSSLPMKLCCASSAESLESEHSITENLRRASPALMENRKASTAPGADLQADFPDSGSFIEENVLKASASIHCCPLETPTVRVLNVAAEICYPTVQSFIVSEQTVTFGQTETAALSPLHIDSVIFESSGNCTPVGKSGQTSPFSSINGSMLGNCSQLIDALDIQSPAQFKPGVRPRLQSTPGKPRVQVKDQLVTPTKMTTPVKELHEMLESSPDIPTKVQSQPFPSPCGQKTEEPRVAEHIQRFNKLTLRSPSGSKPHQIRQPLKFQRTPVRQTVRRINSLMGESSRPVRRTDSTASRGGHVAKAVSLESGLSPLPKLQPQPGRTHVELRSGTLPKKNPPPVPPRKQSTMASKLSLCALGDVTNKVQPKSKMDFSAAEPPGAQKCVVQQVTEKDMSHYRGSPRNPLNQGRLLSATKPIDL